MGTFAGHFLPGISFCTIAIWWLFSITVRYQSRPRSFRNRASYCWFQSNAAPESWIKIAVCTLGFLGELYTAFNGGRFVNFGNLQHMTMYTFFFLSGVTDLLCIRKSPQGLTPLLPPGSDYFVLMTAAVVEWLLFKFHLHGRNPLDVMVHTLLGHTILAAVVVVAAECHFRRSALLGYIRSILVLLQGLWFISVGYILHNPWGPLPFSADKHEDHMIVTCIFAWHILGSILIAVAVTAAASSCVTRYIGRETEYSKCPSDQGNLLRENQDDDDYTV